MKKTRLSISILLLAFLLAGCLSKATPTPQPATIAITFDLGGGGSGFAASLFAQEVTTGKTFKAFYPAGSHGGVVLPTSPPVIVIVDAPGTYVFYGNLIEAPEDYRYGATGCKAGEDCHSSGLLALDVVPGGSYHVTISDSSAPVPTPGAPVAVPWHR